MPAGWAAPGLTVAEVHRKSPASFPSDSRKRNSIPLPMNSSILLLVPRACLPSEDAVLPTAALPDGEPEEQLLRRWMMFAAPRACAIRAGDSASPSLDLQLARLAARPDGTVDFAALPVRVELDLAGVSGAGAGDSDATRAFAEAVAEAAQPLRGTPRILARKVTGGFEFAGIHLEDDHDHSCGHCDGGHGHEGHEGHESCCGHAREP